MNSLSLIIQFVLKAFPAVKKELACWHSYACQHGEEELSRQALASIEHKTFHCLGGSIYSLYPGVSAQQLIRLIVALQTISDYLDNLCDRAGITDEQAFRQLHLAMTDALSPHNELHDYYKYYPYQNDGGYLNALVRTCQQQISLLPAYHLVEPYTKELAELYSKLQTYKHIDISIREQRMLTWAQPYRFPYPGINPWEFSAATGSTLGMFMLCALASDPKLTQKQADQIFAAYFPWICGLHILLDYFIDRAEDQAGGDLNFVSYYQSEEQVLERLTLFWHKALEQADTLTEKRFHKTVIQGLFAMYLSDPKTDNPPEKAIRDALLRSAGPYTRLLYGLCKLLRRRGIL